MNIKVKSMKVTPAVTLAKSRQKESEESENELVKEMEIESVYLCVRV